MLWLTATPSHPRPPVFCPKTTPTYNPPCPALGSPPTLGLPTFVIIIITTSPRPPTLPSLLSDPLPRPFVHRDNPRYIPSRPQLELAYHLSTPFLPPTTSNRPVDDHPPAPYHLRPPTSSDREATISTHRLLRPRSPSSLPALPSRVGADDVPSTPEGARYSPPQLRAYRRP